MHDSTVVNMSQCRSRKKTKPKSSVTDTGESASTLARLGNAYCAFTMPSDVHRSMCVHRLCMLMLRAV